MLDYRCAIVAAALTTGALLVGCDDSNVGGPPNITTVTVMSDNENDIDPSPFGLGRIVETATYCAVGNSRRPGLVGLPDIRVIQLCPEDAKDPAEEEGVAEAAPPAWFVRVVFDKLLDPHIEDLVPELNSAGLPTGTIFGTIKDTQPVTLKCEDRSDPAAGPVVEYDGYYVPNGNEQSWPPGPALKVLPLDPLSVKTGATCTVTVNDNVHSKTGESAPTDHRTFTFKLAPMTFRFSDPDPAEADDGSIVVGLNTPISLFWNAPLTHKPALIVGKDSILPAEFDTSKVTITSGPNLDIGPSNKDGDPNPDVCAGNGTAVDPAKVRAYVAGEITATTALIMKLDIGDPTTAAPEAGWQPNTTYLIEFADDAAVTPAQGGEDGLFPGAKDFSLCFHTLAPPPVVGESR
jgi:hypothetical protein